ncbi:MAG: acyl-CoA thioesterase [Pseudobdellovibrio sp.]
MNSEYKVLIREHHLDSYGHVNNANYLALFEEARWEIITDRGYGYKKVQETAKGPVILEINLKFIKEVKLREMITITLELISYEGKICYLLQKMIKENGDIASELKMTMAFFDLAERKIILPNSEWKHAVGL